MDNLIDCACGCGNKLEPLDKWGRSRKYISGHNGRKYSDKKEHKRIWYDKNKHNPDYRKKSVTNKTERGRRLKASLVEKYGGKCSRCGVVYDGTNSCIFDFHHLDPVCKDFNVNAGAFNIHSLKKIQEEVDKCILLCSNCHRLEHRAVDY